ncbi:hypothetical protein M0R45_036340 [Rubus argutus]|uniref:Uncharacterized protein n=1 Tax=Rubus argutus TaxID=59490 RepID=A0AAW1VVT9_RUBAR
MVKKGESCHGRSCGFGIELWLWGRDLWAEIGIDWYLWIALGEIGDGDVDWAQGSGGYGIAALIHGE